MTGIPAGDYIITATDAAGNNTATQKVTVTEKQQAPTVTVPNNTVSSADGLPRPPPSTVDPARQQRFLPSSRRRGRAGHQDR